MTAWVAFWNILKKDMKNYYLKPPNISWGIVFPVAWTLMFFLKSQTQMEVFEAQTFSNFFRFPMIFLCGLFIPLTTLPIYIRPLSFMLPLTYGADILKYAINGKALMPIWLNFLVLFGFASALFIISVKNIKVKWIY